jgi:acetylornithine/N-succinyldiaminopimelate aminotransferase
VLEIVDEQELLRRVRDLGARLGEAIAALAGVREVRGRGLMLGVGLDQGLDAQELGADLLQRGLIVNVPEPGTIRLLPPLTISDEDAEKGVSLLAEALA